MLIVRRGVCLGLRGVHMGEPNENDRSTAISTGIPGLDDVLCGGLDPERLYLIEGEPGTGKTTIALQYLLEGVRQREKGLYVTLSESERELRLVAKRHGWSIDQLSCSNSFHRRPVSIRSGS